MLTLIDHLVVTAPSLPAGARFIQERLGITLQPGGAHPCMATHNQLLRLGDSCYLEVIAVDPQAPSPCHPRWFGLNALGKGSRPSLTTWVARTVDIDAARHAYGPECGHCKPMNRGTLNWRITVPENGGLPLGGTAPYLIEWAGGDHPATTLEDRGCTLLALELGHPQPARLQAIIASIGVNGPVTVTRLPHGSTPSLRAQIDTPHGLRIL